MRFHSDLLRPARVALVSCVKTKRATASPAGELYTSSLFVGMRSFAQRNADTWYILSAKHGLLRPDQVVDPYETTLKTMKKADRVAWAEQVQQQLLATLPTAAEVIFLAGERYREVLTPFLERRGFTVRVPMAGLKMGRQLQWLNAQGCSTGAADDSTNDE